MRDAATGDLRSLAMVSTARSLALARASHGMVITGILIEGVLAATSEFLVAEIGPEGAYDCLQRSCDRLAAQVAAQHIITTEEEE